MSQKMSETEVKKTKKEMDLNFCDENELKKSWSSLNFASDCDFTERIRKTLYYGKLPEEDRPSLPMTGLAVDFLKDAAPREFGKIDMYWAADVGRKAYVSPCSLMLGMIYIERLKHKNPEYLNQVSSSDLFLISMMVASKYLYDEGIEEEVYNDEWAEAANIEVQDINLLEREFLMAIDWSLFTRKEDFEQLLKSIEERIASRQGLDRGFWTYSDMMVLLDNVQLNGTLRGIVEELCKVVVICCMAYTAGAIAVLGSVTTATYLHSHRLFLCPQGQPTGCLLTPVELLEREQMRQMSRERVAGSENRSYIQDDGYRDDSFLLPDNESAITSTADSIRETADAEEKPVVSGLTLPSFLTLALIKNSVTQVLMVGVTFTGYRGADVGEVKHEELSDGSNGKSVNQPICKCSNCPLRNRKRKRCRYGNGKVTGKNVFVSSTWSNMLRMRGSGVEKESRRRSNGVVHTQRVSGSTGETTGENLSENSAGGKRIESVTTSVVIEASGKCQLESCEMKEEPSIKKNSYLDDGQFKHTGFRIESKFHDLASRFETSAQAAFAG